MVQFVLWAVSVYVAVCASVRGQGGKSQVTIASLKLTWPSPVQLFMDLTLRRLHLAAVTRRAQVIDGASYDLSPSLAKRTKSLSGTCSAQPNIGSPTNLASLMACRVTFAILYQR